MLAQGGLDQTARDEASPAAGKGVQDHRKSRAGHWGRAQESGHLPSGGRGRERGARPQGGSWGWARQRKSPWWEVTCRRSYLSQGVTVRPPQVTKKRGKSVAGREPPGCPGPAWLQTKAPSQRTASRAGWGAGNQCIQLWGAGPIIKRLVPKWTKVKEPPVSWPAAVAVVPTHLGG